MRTPHGKCAVVSQASEACSRDNMFITNQTEFKTTVSALRRELKNAIPEVPSHAAMQELVAKALGAGSYAELLTKLPKEPVKSKASKTEAPQVTSAYPLKNLDGRFDLVEAGEDGDVVLGHSFEPIQGTVETIPNCTAYATQASRKPGGAFDVTYEGGTDVNWNGQFTQKDSQGYMLWVDEDGTVISSTKVLLVPEDFDPQDKSLKVRAELIKEYELYFKGTPMKQQLQSDYAENGYDCQTLKLLAEALGFALTEREVRVLLGLPETADGASA